MWAGAGRTRNKDLAVSEGLMAHLPPPLLASIMAVGSGGTAVNTIKMENPTYYTTYTSPVPDHTLMPATYTTYMERADSKYLHVCVCVCGKPGEWMVRCVCVCAELVKSGSDFP